MSAPLDNTLARIQVSLSTLARSEPDAAEKFLRRYTERAIMQAQTVDSTLATVLLDEELEDASNPLNAMLSVLPDPDLLALDRLLVLGVDLQCYWASLGHQRVDNYARQFLARWMAFTLRLDPAIASQQLAAQLQQSSLFWLTLFLLPEAELLNLHRRLAGFKEAA